MEKQIGVYCILCLLFCSCSTNNTPRGDVPTGPQDSLGSQVRDPYKWPFASTSIWNMPIGSEAEYVHALLEPADGMTVDEDYIVMTPEEPLMRILKSEAGWSWTMSRCETTGDSLFSAPIPQSFVVSPDTWDGVTPNAGLAVLMPDKKTIRQTQPFAHCEEGGFGTSQYVFPDQDIYGDGLYGAHGGSGLSAIGGALRVGELTPNSGPIRHALKINLCAEKNIYYDDETKGFRWPAVAADAGAAESYYTQRTYPASKECRMGALLALPAWMNLDSLNFETEPGRILARAFQDYGAYVVDATGWDVHAIITEWGPDGRVRDEFEKNWGFSMVEFSEESPWKRDVDKIFANLHVVVNNTEKTIGGGGTPRQPLAPPLEIKF